MGPSPGPARAWPEPVLFFKAQAQARLLEKGLENMSFYEVKSRGPSRLRLKLV